MDVIITPDGERHIIGQFRDLADVVESYTGEDARNRLTEYIQDLRYSIREKLDVEENTRVEGVEEYYRSVLKELRELSEELATEIVQPRLNRSKISTIAGSIGTIIYRNM